MQDKRRILSTISPTGRRGKNTRPLDWLEIAEFPYPRNYPWLANFGAGDDRCFVYVIVPEGKWPVKVGISKSPKRRLVDLQGANWKRLRVEYCGWTATRADALAIERFVHDEYAERGKWLLGEWIDARPDEAKERIEWAAMALSINVSFALPDDKISEVQATIDAIWPMAARHAAYGEKYDMTIHKAYGSDMAERR